MRLWGLLLGFWGEVFIGLVHEGKVLIMRLFFFFLLEVLGTSGILDQRRDQAIQDVFLQFTEFLKIIF
jgi:hypothetical protein